MRVLFAGAHPDDIESCAGGTMAKLAALGHEVHGLSFTDGQVGYYKGDKTPCEVGAMRRREMLAASAILGYTPHFSGHMDGSMCAGKREVESFLALLDELNPDMLFAHWPVDTHPDHEAAAAISLQGWLKRSKKKEGFVYCETMSGEHSLHFQPNRYVEVTPYVELKISAYLAHVCQELLASSRLRRISLEERGAEVGRRCCEAFVAPFESSVKTMVLE